MIKKIIFLCVVFISTSFFYAQKLGIDGWIVEGGISLLQYEKENVFKTNAYSSDVLLAKEFPIGKNTSLITGINGLTVFGSYENLSFKSNFIGIPLVLRYNVPSDDNTVFVNFGVNNRYKINEVFEDISSDTSFKGEKGYHFGGTVGFGYRARVMNNADFLLGLNYIGDFANAGYENKKYKMLNGINLAIGIEVFSKKNGN